MSLFFMQKIGREQIATDFEELEIGRKYVSSLNRISAVIDKLRANQAPLRRVMIMEWMNPIYNCEHWIPNQIAIAGGVDMLSNPSEYSVVTDWNKGVQYNPEVLVLAPCVFYVKRAAKDVPFMTSLPF